QDVPEGDAAACRPGAGRGRDPHLPGVVERPLLGVGPAAGQVAVHDPDRDRRVQERVPDTLAAAHGGERHGDRSDPGAVRGFPAVLRRRGRLRRGEGVTLRRALEVALADLYHQAWRMAVLNVLLGTTVFAVVLATLAVRPALILAV